MTLAPLLILCNLTAQTCERKPLADVTCQIAKAYAATQGIPMACVSQLKPHQRKAGR